MAVRSTSSPPTTPATPAGSRPGKNIPAPTRPTGSSAPKGSPTVAGVAGTADIDPDLAPALRMAVLRLARMLRQQDVHTGATMSQLSALSMLALHGTMTLGELAASERVRPPSMTRIAAVLEEQGFVSREPDANDRRVARLRVTPEGERVLTESRARRTAFLQSHLQQLSPAEQAVVKAAVPLLERLAGRDL